MKKYFLDKTEKKYPYVFLPKKIISHINQGYEEKDILKFLNLEKPILNQKIGYKNLSYYQLNKTKNINHILNLKNDSIDDDLENLTFYYEKLKLPRMPSLYNVEEKIYVDYEDGFTNILKTLILIPGIAICLFFAFATIGPIFISFEERKTIPLFKIIIIVALTIYTLILSFTLINGWNNIFKKKTQKVRSLLDEQTRNQLLNKYKTKVKLIIKKVEEDFQNSLNEYHQNLESKYQTAEIGILNNDLCVNQISLIDSKNSQKGRSEITFLKYLYDFFGRDILTDYSPNIGKNPFQPDFILHDKEINFYIDIEIDEPYSILNGETIHHNRTKDEERNSFFNEINWGVIRFTEKQIVESPRLCCVLINDVLQAIKKRENFVVHNIMEENFWTHEEALIMKLNNYRDSYN